MKGLLWIKNIVRIITCGNGEENLKPLLADGSREMRRDGPMSDGLEKLLALVNRFKAERMI